MIYFHIKASLATISDFVEIELDKIFSQNSFDSNGIQATLQRTGSTDIEIDEYNINLSIPLQVLLKKNAGLFSVEGHGSISLKINIQYNINADMKLVIKSDITGHEWIENPVLDFGAIDLPVSKLVDMMLKHYESLITGQIDNAANKNLNLAALVEDNIFEANKTMDANRFHGIGACIMPSEILLCRPHSSDGFLYVDGAVNAEISISDQNMPMAFPKLSFRWANGLAPDNITLATIEVSNDTMAHLILIYLNEQEYGGEKISAPSCAINYTSKGMEISIGLKKPLSGKATIFARPKYNEFEGKLYANDLDIKISADNFLYKLTGPLVSSYMESMIEGKLPVDLNSLLAAGWNELLQKITFTPTADVKIKSDPIQLTELLINEDGIFGKIKASNLSVNTVLNEMAV